MVSITVGTFLQEKNEELKLELLAGVEGLQRPIKVSEVNRPGLALTGYYEHFPSERIQIIGMGEYTYLNSLAQEKQREILEKLLSMPDVPCCILARGLEPLPEMQKAVGMFMK